MSQAPPPFSPSAPPQPRRDKSTTIILIIILALVAFCIIGVVAFGFLGFSFFKNTVGPMAGCVINFEATREAVLDYAKEHNGQLPNAATWQDDVRSYVKKRIKEYADKQPFELMNADGEWGCRIGNDRKTGIAFNTDVSGKKLAEVPNQRVTIVIFEVEQPGKNAAESYKPRPESTSPTIMGEHRGWIAVPLEGDIDIKMDNQRWRSDSSPPDEPVKAESAKTSAPDTETK